MIYPEHLKFFQVAKEAFEKHPEYETYRNEDDTLIALRYGMDRDGIVIYRLDGEVAHFANVIGVNI